MMTWRDAAADMFLGATCPGCQRPSWRLCDDCRAQLAAYPAELHNKSALSGLPHWAGAPFAGLAGHLVTAAKDRRRWDVIPHLGARLATAVVELLASVPWLEPIWLTPIPSAPSAVRRRGLDVSCRLAASAQGFLRQAGLDCRTQRWLRLARPVADQAGLNYHQRQLNLAGAYRLIRSPPAADRQAGLILVDDVATTGASLAEGWRVCRQADLMVLGAATVTATSDRYDSAVASVVNRIQVPVLRQEKTSPA